MTYKILLMDYMDQIEKLYKYFEFNLELNLMHSLVEMKHQFNNDFNLIGCFLKDYLVVKTNKTLLSDEDLYEEFVLYFENESKTLPSEFLINDIVKYSKYYLSIVFEDFSDENIMIAVSTVNSCFAMEYYPVIMKVLNKYYSGGFSVQNFKIVLDSIVDVVLKNFEQTDILEITPIELEEEIKKTVLSKQYKLEEVMA